VSQPEENFTDVIEAVLREDGRFRVQACQFLHEALGRAVNEVHGADATHGHVSGQALCESLRDLAWDRYGPLAPTVLQRWGITSSYNFGELVYLLIEHDLMGKEDGDTVEDFRDGFDMERDFDRVDTLTLQERGA
jgi:uncharacterized repeat protein (TIGR04138 family)